MVISYIYLICWRMKSTFYERQQHAGSSNVVCAVAIIGSGKHQARPLTDHFKKLLEETCPNHIYPIKHKFRDYDMMKNFMASGSLARGMEVDEVPDKGDMMPFPREDAVMMIYDGHSSSERGALN
jgi:hypothetical protein